MAKTGVMNEARNSDSEAVKAILTRKTTARQPEVSLPQEQTVAAAWCSQAEEGNEPWVAVVPGLQHSEDVRSCGRTESAGPRESVALVESGDQPAAAAHTACLDYSTCTGCRQAQPSHVAASDEAGVARTPYAEGNARVTYAWGAEGTLGALAGPVVAARVRARSLRREKR